MMTNRGVLVLLSLLVAAACRTGPPATVPPESAGPAPVPPTASTATPRALEIVRVGTILNASDAPFYIAQERGYLREEGLDIEVTQFDGAQRAIAPLGADQLDVAAGGPGPGLFNAI
jgi:NitT/TauT family transport system substrate-binding protein